MESVKNLKPLAQIKILEFSILIWDTKTCYILVSIIYDFLCVNSIIFKLSKDLHLDKVKI